MDVVRPSVEEAPLRWQRPIVGIVLIAAIVVAAIVVTKQGPPAENMIRIGRIQDFTQGSAKALTLNAAFLNPNLAYAPSSQGNPTATGPIGKQTPIRVWVVKDQTEGLLVMLNRSPHLGCRITRPDELKNQAFASEVASFHAFFVDPCGGSMFSYTGRWLKGPAP